MAIVCERRQVASCSSRVVPKLSCMTRAATVRSERSTIDCLGLYRHCGSRAETILMRVNLVEKCKISTPQQVYKTYLDSLTKPSESSYTSISLHSHSTLSQPFLNPFSTHHPPTNTIMSGRGTRSSEYPVLHRQQLGRRYYDCSCDSWWCCRQQDHPLRRRPHPV